MLMLIVRNAVEMSIPFTLVDFVRLSNLIELRNFGYKIKVCNLICCLVSRGHSSVSASFLHTNVLNTDWLSFLPFDVKECCRYLKLVIHSIRPKCSRSSSRKWWAEQCKKAEFLGIHCDSSNHCNYVSWYVSMYRRRKTAKRQHTV